MAVDYVRDTLRQAAAAGNALQERQVIPRFLVQAVEQTFESKQKGRPVYKDAEFCEIRVAGDRGHVAFEPVNEEHIARWPELYQAFKDGLELPPEGTPLANWPNPMMTRSMVEELAYFNIRTIEHLAGVNDNQMGKLPMGMRELRTSARTFLEVAEKGTGPLERLLADNQSKGDEIAMLKDQMAEMRARLDALAPKGRNNDAV